MSEVRDFIKQTIIAHLIEAYGHIDNIENLIQVKENKDISKGNYSISFHAFANAINKKEGN